MKCGPSRCHFRLTTFVLKSVLFYPSKVLGKISSDTDFVFLTDLFPSPDWKMVTGFTPFKKKLCLHNEGVLTTLSEKLNNYSLKLIYLYEVC